ncbi:phage minor tail U family protein [Mannheimia haemolytica]|nr:phage minor tail U family protein [Mannheimia haemolytica]UQX80671.1 phage minor tail U family protein [Mannheimia haemolytica]
MKIHTQIRKEILSLLEAKLTDIEHFYNGQPNFIDIDEQQLAISV